MTGSLVFRCKRCATVYAQRTEIDLVVALNTPGIGHIHDCAVGALGVGELIGAIAEPMTTAEFAKHVEDTR